MAGDDLAVIFMRISTMRWFVSRHPGARVWLQEEGHQVDRQVAHLDVADIAPGDTVYGSLPVHMAAAVCARGACYVHLSMEMPASARGTELDADQLRSFGARLIPFQITGAK